MRTILVEMTDEVFQKRQQTSARQIVSLPAKWGAEINPRKGGQVDIGADRIADCALGVAHIINQSATI